MDRDTQLLSTALFNTILDMDVRTDAPVAPSLRTPQKEDWNVLWDKVINLDIHAVATGATEFAWRQPDDDHVWLCKATHTGGAVARYYNLLVGVVVDGATTVHCRVSSPGDADGDVWHVACRPGFNFLAHERVLPLTSFSQLQLDCDAGECTLLFAHFRQSEPIHWDRHKMRVPVGDATQSVMWTHSFRVTGTQQNFEKAPFPEIVLPPLRSSASDSVHTLTPLGGNEPNQSPQAISV